ncbi:hypothetical protein J4E83_006582 [Alternaria metachromatica]|uniref:uncharacterized protein n=1 Tax=Alternaria metachromatica TaxID=283354 RepID=UPI0020C2C87B|nr:uncharacterized protein J4E83_006582 [Alternaria metachromatica]KAI4615914.1 hypothetical protein J4E83_006582 [Alternaria metachromatica]
MLHKRLNLKEPSKEQQIFRAKRDREQVRQIASKLYAKVPREVRDEVYRYIVADCETMYFGSGLGGLSTASDEEFVTSDYKVFCPSYVGYEVAREAAECYYATNVFEVGTQAISPDWASKRPGLPQLMPLLAEDCFNLGVLPYKFIRQIYIRIVVTDICPRMPIGSEELLWRELSNLGNLHSDLESALSLVEHKAKLDVRVQISPDEPRWYGEARTEWKDSGLDEMEISQRIGFLNVERSILNVLEAMRKPLYDLKYAGSSITIMCQTMSSEDDRKMQGLFYLTEEDWQKEKEEHTLQSGYYRPYRNFIEQSMLADGPLSYKEEFANNLPQFRRRWGYKDFQKFMSPPEDDGYYDDAYEERESEDEDGDSEDEDGDSDDEYGGKQPKHGANYPPLEMYPREMMERIQMMKRLGGPSWGVLPEERA